ncbi:non-ribosomal peptide synthetase [Flavobacterium sp. CSZ]|uniref:non-ribosomal peptide synthetase n=1 Tax=Flavobacterium sp. CSZ TaxID=2783791 RepID=UPI00188D7F60|nr:non-ribosomal peptide synthetase [Flavobacterium sp. CSZ]MBF4485715.1 amino acid adenylation domain-containing protein [Flavobacterium sp. CSZ]
MKLTLSQQDIYLEQLIYPTEPIYNIGAKIEIKGSINIEIFQKAYIEVINQHDTYRTKLVKKHDNVDLKIVDKHNSELGLVDFSKNENPYESANVYMQQEFSKPFDLFGEGLLHIFTLVKVEEGFHYLFSVYHHIITDGWGTSLMFQRLVQNYNEILEFGAVQTSYPFIYKEFIEDDAMYQTSDSFTEDALYWKDKFKILPENLFDKTAHVTIGNKSSRKELIIKRALYNELNQVAAAYKCSTFHLILAIVYAYFGRKQQNDDFAIGLPVLNRSSAKYKKTVGLFMGISPLRVKIDFNLTVQQFTQELKNQLRNDYRHQRFPIGKLIQELQLFQEKEKLFNITLSYEKQNYSSNFHGTATEVIPLSHQSERAALALYIREFDELKDVKIDFDYNLNYFNESAIIEITNHFENLIFEVLNHPEKKLRDLQYLSENELEKVLVKFNDTQVNYPKGETILGLFSEKAAKMPGKIILKDHYRSYSYCELDKLSSQIAEKLIGIYGGEDQSPIAVLMSRSANMVVVLLGILKAGRSYIPLDPVFPEDRLRYIIENSASKVLISQKGYELAGLEDVEVLTLENIFEGLEELEGVVRKKITAADTAYIIYTSGSTGNPKGVEIGHRSLLNFLTSMQKEPGVTTTDTLFSVTTYSFDISILEFFVPLLSGATLYIASQEILQDPNLIIEKLEEIKPTIIQATPSFYQMLFNANWKGDQGLKILCGGDLLSESLAERLIKSSLEVWNMYGPTETTIWSSIKKIEQPKDASNIGKPINNTKIYILDQYLFPQPIGTQGAIYIGGDGLAKGYYKNISLTNEKFTLNPFDDKRLFYETGDVGKWNDKGEIEFLGRNDNQVKIRGYRIELGDIEAQLNTIFAIKESVVVVKKGSQEEAFLVAYILTEDQELNTEAILKDLKTKLPYYMIPNVVVAVKEFPLTPNQKVDRKFLSQQTVQQNLDNFKKPVSNLEIKLSQYWKEILNVEEEISLNDNFLVLGGHSLKAIKLTGLIAKELSFDISLKTIFEYPTIELLANYLQELREEQSSVIVSAQNKALYDLTPSQYNIWLASQHINFSIAYNMFSAYKVEGEIDINRITNAINSVIRKYEIIRTNFVELDGIPYQKINSFENINFSIPIVKSGNKSVKKAISQFTTTAFDLETDLLLRVQLLQTDENRFILLFCTHHIIMDGLSLEFFIEELIGYYNENASLQETEAKNSKLQFKDYSEWINKKAKDNYGINMSFWTQYLQNYVSKDSFDRDFETDANLQNGNAFAFELTHETTLALRQLALREQVTFYTILITTLNVLIHKYSDHNDILIGTVSSGREAPELLNQIGMFAKPLILRTQIEAEQTFNDLLKNTQTNILNISEYQEVPFEAIKKSFSDIMLVYQNPEFSFESITDLNDFQLSIYKTENKYSRIPLVFNLFESDHKLKGTIDYNCDLYKEETVKTIALKYCDLLNDIINTPQIEIHLLDIQLELEKNAVFDFEFNF